MSNSQSNCNNNMVNLYNCRLKEIHLDEKINEAHEKLHRWREECHKTIDEYHEKKMVQFNTYINEIQIQRNELIEKIQNLSQLNNENNSTIIQLIEQNLKNLEEIILQFQCRQLTIDENFIHIEKNFNIQNVKEIVSFFQYSNESSSAITSNERFLLMHQQSYLNLIDFDCKITRQISWSYDWIRDMCWSTTLQRFIIITAKNIYSINETLGECVPLQDHFKQSWFSCTCSQQYLYLSTCQWGSSIFQLNLTPLGDLVKEWKSPLTCQVNEGINDIKYNNQTIAILIKDSKEHQRRLDLKSTENFNTIWSYTLGISRSILLFTCCPINSNEWLVINGANQQISHITGDGKLKGNVNYPFVPYRANLFQSIVLAISTEYDLQLYRIFT